MRAFHTTYYRPDNAVLVLVGDFDPAQANAWVDRYFGALRKPAAAIPRVTAVEPAQTAQRRVTYASKSAPLPAAVIAYHVPAASSSDGPVLDVVEALLGRGASARLRSALIDRAGVASQIYANADERQQPGVFDVMAIASAGHTSADLVAALGAEVARLRDEPVAPDELERAKTQEISAVVRQLQTHDQVAQALARAVVVNGDPNDLNRYPSAYLRVTQRDVQRVARRYLTVANSTVVEYETAAQGGGGAAK